VRLAMTLLVRDGADMIDANLRYHRAQGVDLFLVGDNGSTDGTVEILERYERAGLITFEQIPGPAREAQGEGRTRLARLAWELGADWVFHNDLDEFWWPFTGDLKQALAAIPERFGLVLAPRSEFVGRPGEGFFADRLTVREARFRRPPQTAHRTHPQVMISQPHPTHIWVDHGVSPRRGLVGRLIRRAQAEHVEEAELELLLAPMFPLGVLHFPLRSFGQYRHKVELALANDQLREDERVPSRGGLLRSDPRRRGGEAGAGGRLAGRGHRVSRLPGGLPGDARWGRNTTSRSTRVVRGTAAGGARRARSRRDVRAQPFPAGQRVQASDATPAAR
jgi:hypothetical protein